MARRSLPLALLLCVCACGSRPPPPPPAAPPAPAPKAEEGPPPGLEQLFWTSYGQDGAVLLQIRQTARSRNSCHVSVQRGGSELWTSERCLSTRGQMRFLSPDGERLLVLIREPEVNGPASDVELGVLYARDVLVRRYTVGEVLGSTSGSRIEAGVLHWLHNELPRDIPGGVRVTLADGRGEFLFFDGGGVPNSAVPQRMQAQPVRLSRGPGPR
jgi:hypothetical protein